MGSPHRRESDQSAGMPRPELRNVKLVHSCLDWSPFKAFGGGSLYGLSLTALQGNGNVVSLVEFGRAQASST